MPLFFFVTGASNSFGNTNGYFRFVFKRYKRILIPYWVFAVICASLSISYSVLSKGADFFTVIKILLSWLIPVDKQITSIRYLTWALWFVPVYLCVVLFIPLLKQIKQCSYAKQFAVVLFALFLITSLLNLGWFQNVTFYLFWTYIGLFYSDLSLKLNQCRFRKYLKSVTLAGIVTLIILFLLDYPIDMQQNKFPPNIMFAIFSIVAVSLILLGLPLVSKVYDRMGKYKVISRVADLFATHSMTIFLYQVFAFNFSIRLTRRLFPDSSLVMSIVKSVICLILTVPLCALFALIFGRVEQIGARKGPKHEKNN